MKDFLKHMKIIFESRKFDEFTVNKDCEEA